LLALFVVSVAPCNASERGLLRRFSIRPIVNIERPCEASLPGEAPSGRWRHAFALLPPSALPAPLYRSSLRRVACRSRRRWRGSRRQLPPGGACHTCSPPQTTAAAALWSSSASLRVRGITTGGAASVDLSKQPVCFFSLTVSCEPTRGGPRCTATPPGSWRRCC